VAAVVDAATKLISERGPAAVSLRDVAAAADVTLSQIHRHIGNKQALLVEVLNAELVSSDLPVPSAADLDLAALLERLLAPGPPPVRTKLQVRIILDGYDLRALQDRYPGVDLAVELLSQVLPDDQARVRAALLTTFVAGWQMLGPTYLGVVGVDDVDSDRFTEILTPVIHAIASAPPAP
jgi:AcrR family transcriptional regulator